MESRLLYSATKSLKNRIQWTSFEKGNEWIHFGTLENTDIDLVDRKIKEYFNDNEIYLVHQRTNSGLLSQHETKELFKTILGVSNFHLWNKELDEKHGTKSEDK